MPGDQAKYESGCFAVTITGIDRAIHYPLSCIVFEDSDAKGNDSWWKLKGMTKHMETGVGLGNLHFPGESDTCILESLMPLTRTGCMIDGEQHRENVTAYGISFKRLIG